MHLVPPPFLSPSPPVSPRSPTETSFKKKIIGAYEIGKTLGKGSYSTVKRAYHIETRAEVAIKIMSPGTKCDLEDIDREIAILKLLKHPNIIHLLDVIHDAESKKIYLVFELVNGGDLFDYTIARGRLSEREARRIMREVVSGVAYCHAHMVVHRDLKLENLLMDKDGHAKIADFGMSGIMQPGLRMNTYCGSPMYMSPEIVRGLGYGPGVDIWSLGVVLYTIVVGCTPWKLSKENSVEDLDAMLAGHYTIPCDVKLTPACEELISLMIVPEHAERASIEQIMVHPWLSEGYDNPVMVPLNINPITEINEVVVKRMVAMGFTDAQTRKAINEDLPSPARMVYQHMVQLMEEGCETPLIPASPRRRNSATNTPCSPRSPSPRSANTSPRRSILDGPLRTRASSDARRSNLVTVVHTSLRSSCDNIPQQFASYSQLSNPAGSRSAFSTSCSGLPVAPLSPRTALMSSWRLAQMSTIFEEHPVALSTETPGKCSPREPFNKNVLPTLALKLDHQQYPSAPCSPASPGSPISSLNPLSSPVSPSVPTSPHPSSATNSTTQAGWKSQEEPLVVVRGAFNVATTTLKPRRTLLAAISRALTEAGITYALSQSVFKCKLDSEEGKECERDRNKDKDGEKDDILKFEVEVCRVAGLEMLLGVRFQKVEGNKWEYQEICKRLMVSMKL